MSQPRSRSLARTGERVHRIAAAGLLVVGALGMVVGGGAHALSWYNAWTWSRSGQAERAERALQVEAPRWVEPGAKQARVETSVPREAGPSLPRGEVSLAEVVMPPRGEPTPTWAPVGDLELVDVELQFFDPAEQGAHARLSVTLANHADAPSAPIELVIGRSWFEDFEVIGAIPSVIADWVDEDNQRHFEFGGPPAGRVATFELHVAALGDEVDAPDFQVGLTSGEPIGRARPNTFAPRPRPGPARALSIPRLGIRAAVVPTAWEPPPFVVGQILSSANLSEGNSVLIGHLGGLSGDVFARLDLVRPGDEVVAVSRGLEYRFVVSETKVLPNDDQTPLLPTSGPRLTLMTCIGYWNPFTRDYSERVWVIAEPPELAEQTISVNARRAVEAPDGADELPAVEALAEPAAEVGPAQPTQPVAAFWSLFPAPPTEGAGSTERHRRPARGAPLAVGRPLFVDPMRAPEAAPTLGIVAPAAEALVPSRFVVEGWRARPIDSGLHVWLLVRARVDGGRWYAYPEEIRPDPDGSWAAELELGGPPGVRHELRVGLVDARSHERLAGYVADHPNEPLEDLPPGLHEAARLVVTRD
ncbi:MAG TPA: sortase [Chloroflexota bacterium]|nr:sortase [Chloroflexota bacterium]